MVKERRIYESDDFVPGEEGFSLEAEVEEVVDVVDEEEVELEAPVEEVAAPKVAAKGVVYTRLPNGALKAL